MKKIKELLDLSEETLGDLELDRVSIEKICLKVSRLARLLWDENAIKWMKFEINWYPLDCEWNYTKEAYFISWKYSNREFFDKNKKKSYIFTETIPTIESKIEASKLELSVLSDPDVSVSSSNPNQAVFAPFEIDQGESD